MPVECVQWPKDRRERVSINSFGIGGANAHVILDSANELSLGYNKKALNLNLKSQLLVFTGNNAHSAKKGSTDLAEFVQSHPGLISDVAYTLARHREFLPYRTFAVTDGTSSPVFSAEFKVASIVPGVIFVFTGQGAHWAGMGRRLAADFPSVSLEIASMDETLSELGEFYRPTWSLKGMTVSPCNQFITNKLIRITAEHFSRTPQHSSRVFPNDVYCSPDYCIQLA